MRTRLGLCLQLLGMDMAKECAELEDVDYDSANQEQLEHAFNSFKALVNIKPDAQKARCVGFDKEPMQLVLAAVFEHVKQKLKQVRLLRAAHVFTVRTSASRRIGCSHPATPRKGHSLPGTVILTRHAYTS